MPARQKIPSLVLSLVGSFICASNFCFFIIQNSLSQHHKNQ
jgi:hypothetical protein